MKIDKHPKKNQITIGLGGGCHWCTEAIYTSLKGMISVEQGWISSNPPDDAFSEAVFVTFDTQKIDLKDIIEIHLYTHSSTANHAMRKKYRSAVYAMSKEDQKQLGLLLTELQKEFKESLVTRALLFKDFKKSEEQYLDYYYKNPDKPFCQTYIQPKLKMLLQKYPNIVDDTVNDMGDLLITNKPSN